MTIATYQVIFIQCENDRLYGELVQRVPERRICWVRPLSLCLSADSQTKARLLDVRNGPDIICADHLIQPALDTEWIAVLNQLSILKVACDYPEANQFLRRFLQKLPGKSSDEIRS